ncbi:unnamed protein product [Thelazia callipaeda]|uniref:C2H2-type domain-containing protein n=1 Tax=Thelazia callipaeda TaxID=103827 RepID=A0A0N5CVP8_THECL|nr:unnamed protein product [Thelazia callipaeda]
MEDDKANTISLNDKICQNSSAIASLVCQQCDATLPNFIEFGCHMRSHLINSDQKQKCNFCNVAFYDPIARISHLVDHFIENSIHILCKKCPTISFYTFQQIQQHHADAHLEEHSITHIEEVLRYQCTACNISFETRDLFAIHVQLVHDRPTLLNLPYNNNQQNVVTVNSSKRQGITDIQVGSRLVKCMVCDIKFENEDKLDFHRLIMHCKEVQVIPIQVLRSDRCANCQAEIHTAAQFKDHMHEHIRKERNIMCIICRQALRNDTQIDVHAKYHMQMIHNSSELNERSEICQQHFPKESLEVHIVEHSSQGDCPYCEKHFSDIHCLLSHIDSKHSNQQAIIQCQTCHKAFHFKSQLQNHRCQSSVQGIFFNSPRKCASPKATEQNAFQFPYCPESENALQGNFHAHSKQAFCCDLCTLTFSSHTRFEAHRKTHVDEEG